MGKWILILALLITLDRSAVGQSYVGNFTTSIGNGSFMFNTNNLSFAGATNNQSTYVDSFDAFSFNGVTLSNVVFGIVNNFNVGGSIFVDVLIIQAGNYISNTPLVTLNAAGNSSLINGTTISDVVTLLNTLPASSFLVMPLVNYQNDWPNPGQSGSFTSLELVPVPEPATLCLTTLGTVGLLLRRRLGKNR